MKTLRRNFRQLKAKRLLPNWPKVLWHKASCLVLSCLVLATYHWQCRVVAAASCASCGDFGTTSWPVSRSDPGPWPVPRVRALRGNAAPRSASPAPTAVDHWTRCVPCDAGSGATHSLPCPDPVPVRARSQAPQKRVSLRRDWLQQQRWGGGGKGHINCITRRSLSLVIGLCTRKNFRCC